MELDCYRMDNSSVALPCRIYELHLSEYARLDIDERMQERDECFSS